MPGRNNIASLKYGPTGVGKQDTHGHISVPLTHGMREALVAMWRSGLYGRTLTATATEVLCQGLRARTIHASPDPRPLGPP